MKVSLGKIIGAHGVLGAIKVRSYTKNPTDIAKYSPLEDNLGGKYEIEKVFGVKNDEMIFLTKEIKDRTQAEKLRGLELLADREKLPKIAEDEFYFQDILGFCVQDETGKNLGEILGVANFGASDLLEVGNEDKSIMVLMKAIKDVQMESKKVIIDSEYVVL
jgi:16S rRNA processing protein RimM